MAEFPLQDQRNQWLLIIKRSPGQGKGLFSSQTVTAEMIPSRWKGEATTGAEGGNNGNESATTGLAEKRKLIAVKLPVAGKATGWEEQVLYAFKKRHASIREQAEGPRTAENNRQEQFPRGIGGRVVRKCAGQTLHSL